MSCWYRGFRKHCNIHRNGTYFGYDGYDKHGLDRRNFCKNGFFFMQKGELYDSEGYDKDGFDKDGFDKDGWNKCGWNKVYLYS